MSVKVDSFTLPSPGSLIKRKLVFEADTPCALTKTLHIGYGIDALFARPAGVSITSVAANNPNIKLIFHVLTDSIKEPDLKRFSRLAAMYPNIAIHVYFIDNTFFAAFPTVPNISSATYYRLMLPLFLEGKAERLLYLDADIICQNAIDELTGMDISRYTVLAFDEDAELAQIPGFHLQNKHYFNAGVLLIDVEKWNSQDVSSDTRKILSSTEARAFKYLDQDALNVVLNNGRVGFLNSKWNKMIHYQDKPAPADTIFLHFYLQPKPWSISYESPNQHLYSRYMGMSPWADTPLQMPRNYKEMRLYGKKLWRKRLIGSSLHWYMKYLIKKFMYKLKLSPFNAVNVE